MHPASVESKANNKSITHGMWRIRIGWFFPPKDTASETEKNFSLKGKAKQSKTITLFFLSCDWNNVCKFSGEWRKSLTSLLLIVPFNMK